MESVMEMVRLALYGILKHLRARMMSSILSVSNRRENINDTPMNFESICKEEAMPSRLMSMNEPMLTSGVPLLC